MWKTDWFKIKKEVWQGCLLSPCLFNLYTEHIIRNARLDKLQDEIKAPGRNINNLRYADDTTLTPESEKELKSLLTSVKEENEKAGLKLSIKKIKIMTSSPISSRQIEGENVEAVTDFFFPWAPKSLRMVIAAMKLKDACSLEGKLWQT